MNNAIEIKNMDFSFNGINILEDINLEVKEKDFVGIIGPNGGGKTTLLRIVMGLLIPRKGSVKILDSSPIAARSKIGYVPQFGTSEKIFPIKTIDVVAMGLCGARCMFPWFSKSIRERSLEIMKSVKIEDLAEKSFNRAFRRTAAADSDCAGFGG